VQLGELQQQYGRFASRNASVLALSVDPTKDSEAMAARLGLQFTLGSDPNQRIIQQFRVQNPDTRALALHAVYIVDQQAKVFYRKVGSRRPRSAELIDAIDAYYGTYPQFDGADETGAAIAVAYPQTNFQALLEVSAATALPAPIDRRALDATMTLIFAGRSDDAVFAFRDLITASPYASREDLFATAAWMVRQRFFSQNQAAMDSGKALRELLNRINALERAATAGADSAHLSAELNQARTELGTLRKRISQSAEDWNLRYAKTMLRSYRELARAGRALTTQ
jgi:hypothetical protein